MPPYKSKRGSKGAPEPTQGKTRSKTAHCVPEQASQEAAPAEQVGGTFMPKTPNVASVPQRSPFRYPGGKTWFVPVLRAWLKQLARKPRTFIEPFAGGAIAGLTVAFESLADDVLLAEIDPEVAGVWEAVCSGYSDAIASMILEFEFSNENVQRVLDRAGRGVAQKAFRTVVRNRVQHGGILAPGASMIREGEAGKGLGSRWYPETLARRFREIGEKTNLLRFERRDALSVIADHSTDVDAVFFIDPPYTVAGRRLYTFSDIDHPRLFAVLSGVAGDFLMTYDDSPEVEGWAAHHNLEVERVPMKSRQHTAKKELVVGRDLGWLREARLAIRAEAKEPHRAGH